MPSEVAESGGFVYFELQMKIRTLLMLMFSINTDALRLSLLSYPSYFILILSPSPCCLPTCALLPPLLWLLLIYLTF